MNAQFRVLALARDEFRQTPEEEFDGSLLHRLSAHTVRMPGLAERAADIPVLAEHLVERFAARAGRRFSGFSPLALRALMNHTWPDNLPELESEMRFAESMRAEHEDSDGVIQLDDLSEPIREAADPESLEGYHQSVRQARRAIILDAMDRALGSHSEAADLLQINRTYLHRLIRNLGLKDEIRRRFPRGGRNDNDDE